MILNPPMIGIFISPRKIDRSVKFQKKMVVDYTLVNFEVPLTVPTNSCNQIYVHVQVM